MNTLEKVGNPQDLLPELEKYREPPINPCEERIEFVGDEKPHSSLELRRIVRERGSFADKPSTISTITLEQASCS